MQTWVTVIAKTALVLLLMLSLVCQVLVIPVAAASTIEAFPTAEALRVPGIAWGIAVVATGQALLIITWRLLTMVAKGRIFQRSALQHVSAMVWCAVVFLLLMVAGFVALNLAAATPPLVMWVIIAAALVGVAGLLVLIVMKGLLATATTFSEELAEVV